MKKIGTYTVRGSGLEGSAIKVQLFDGRFDTAYKVTKFTIWPVSVQDAYDHRAVGKLGTTDDLQTASATFMNADDNREIAWCGIANGAIESVIIEEGLVDTDNLIVEDLYVYFRSNQNEKVNYMITMDKYDISEWQGALAMVRNSAQNV
tara:strand:+ start:580 stop:1026 length:447 start_codon:yes stop_codon:yes gene_type:complete